MSRSTSMACPVAERSYRLPPYSGMAVASLRLGALLALGLIVSGCAVTGGLGGVFAKSKTDEAQAQSQVQSQAQVQAQAEAEVHAQALASEDSTASTSSP